MTTTTIKQAARNFFTLRPVRDYSITTKTAVLGSAAVVLTQIGDAVSTIIGLGAGAVEANGIMGTLIVEKGFGAFFGIKVLAALLLVYYTWKRRYAPWFIAAMYSAVIVWNMHVIGKL